MSISHSTHLSSDQYEPLSMTELESVSGGLNLSIPGSHDLDFLLWVLKKNQASENMVAFYANQHAH
ncbi:MAG: hypothetical protein ACK6BM_06885 [Cyanobacteriota bacterium]|jgi:hypothetical protein